MSSCPNGHNSATVRYDANGWRRWCGQCGALMIDERVSVPHPSAVRVAALGTLKLLAGIATVISLIAAVSVAAALIVYLLSLLVPSL